MSRKFFASLVYYWSAAATPQPVDTFHAARPACTSSRHLFGYDACAAVYLFPPLAANRTRRTPRAYAVLRRCPAASHILCLTPTPPQRRLGIYTLHPLTPPLWRGGSCGPPVIVVLCIYYTIDNIVIELFCRDVSIRIYYENRTACTERSVKSRAQHLSRTQVK